MQQIKSKSSNNKSYKILITFIVTFTLSCSPLLAASKKVELTAADGYRIAGDLTQTPGNAGVILLHMFRHNKESWQPLIDQLTVSGITSLAIDLRGHGESRRNPNGSDDSVRVKERDPVLFNQMHQDAEAAVRYLVDHGTDPEKIGLIGASVGCSVAIHTVSNETVASAAVVLMTPGKNYLGIPTLDHIKNWQYKPLLILTSEEEKNRGAVTIYTKLKNKGAQLQIFDNEDIHGTNMFEEVDGVEKLITSWLTKILLR